MFQQLFVYITQQTNMPITDESDKSTASAIHYRSDSSHGV